MAEIRCRTCRKPVGEVFGFCSSCGEPLCPECLWKYPKEHAEEKMTGVPGVAYRTTTLTKRLPRCVGCVNAQIRAEKEARRAFRRDALVTSMVFFLPLLGLILYAFRLDFNKPEGVIGIIFPVAMLLVLGLFIGYFVASGLGNRRRRRMLKDRPLVFKSMFYCPSCGSYSKKDLFKTAKKIIKGQQKSVLDSLFGYSGQVPDFYQCSGCGYSGPMSPIMGVHLYLQKYGKKGEERLRGTVWESLSVGAA
ncbi:MAG: hypothetical protein ACE5QF_06545 [Thermoplasmata archaeon]